MHSSHAIWEMDQVKKKLAAGVEKSSLAIFCPDAWVENILKEKIFSESCISRTARTLLGKELDPDWVNDNLLSLDLFSSDELYSIIEAHDLKEATSKHLLENMESIESQGKSVIFWFRKKSKFYDALKKKGLAQCFTLTLPKFWEFGKLLGFALEERGIRLEPRSEQYLLDTLEQEPSAYWSAVESIALRGGEGSSISHEIVMECIGDNRLDQFELAQAFGRKDLARFLEKLMEHAGDFQKMDSFFWFLESHVIKLMDPGYIDSKPRPNKYDKQIQQHSRLWKSNELERFLKVLGQWMILSKKKDPGLKDQLRLAWLKLH